MSRAAFPIQPSDPGDTVRIVLHVHEHSKWAGELHIVVDDANSVVVPLPPSLASIVIFLAAARAADIHRTGMRGRRGSEYIAKNRKRLPGSGTIEMGSVQKYVGRVHALIREAVRECERDLGRPLFKGLKLIDGTGGYRLLHDVEVVGLDVRSFDV